MRQLKRIFKDLCGNMLCVHIKSAKLHIGQISYGIKLQRDLLQGNKPKVSIGGVEGVHLSENYPDVMPLTTAVLVLKE